MFLYVSGAVGPVIFKKTKAGQTVCSRPAHGTMAQTPGNKYYYTIQDSIV